MSEKTFDLNTLSARLRHALKYIRDDELELLKAGNYDRFFELMWRWPNVGRKSITEMKIALGLIPPAPVPTPQAQVDEARVKLELIAAAIADEDWQHAAQLTGHLSHLLILLRNDTRRRERDIKEAAKLTPVGREASPRDMALFHLVVLDNVPMTEAGRPWHISGTRVQQIIWRVARREFDLKVWDDDYLHRITYLRDLREEFQGGRTQRRPGPSPDGRFYTRRQVISEQQRDGLDEGRECGEVRPREPGRE